MIVAIFVVVVVVVVVDVKTTKKLIRITHLCKEVITQCIAAPPNFCLPTQRSLLELESIL